MEQIEEQKRLDEIARLKYLDENDPVKRKARAQRRLRIFLWAMVTPHLLRLSVQAKVDTRKIAALKELETKMKSDWSLFHDYFLKTVKKPLIEFCKIEEDL